MGECKRELRGMVGNGVVGNEKDGVGVKRVEGTEDLHLLEKKVGLQSEVV